MKVKLDSDEWYPVFSLTDQWGTEVDVHPDQLQRWQRIEREFADMQKEMREMHVRAIKREIKEHNKRLNIT